MASVGTELCGWARNQIFLRVLSSVDKVPPGWVSHRGDSLIGLGYVLQLALL